MGSCPLGIETLLEPLSSGLLKKQKFLKAASVFVTGTDLFMITNYTGADPAVNGTTATSGGVGAWGFDFGKIGANRSVSFGLRASLQ